MVAENLQILCSNHLYPDEFLTNQMECDPIIHFKYKLATTFRGLFSPSQGESFLVIFSLSWALTSSIMLDLQFILIILLFYIWLGINSSYIWESIYHIEHFIYYTEHCWFLVPALALALFLICLLFLIALLMTMKIWALVVLFNFF